MNPHTFESAKVLLIHGVRIRFDEDFDNEIAVLMATPDRLQKARRSQAKDRQDRFNELSSKADSEETHLLS
jgi:hypothetical protein